MRGDMMMSQFYLVLILRKRVDQLVILRLFQSAIAIQGVILDQVGEAVCRLIAGICAGMLPNVGS